MKNETGMSLVKLTLAMDGIEPADIKHIKAQFLFWSSRAVTKNIGIMKYM